MSGQDGLDEAARLEAAMYRIARAAAAHAARRADHSAAGRELHTSPGHARTDEVAAEMATRLDALITELRSVLGTQT